MIKVGTAHWDSAPGGWAGFGVTPAKAGVQGNGSKLDPGVRRNDTPRSPPNSQPTVAAVCEGQVNHDYN